LRRRALRGNNGFTLIEALLAMALFILIATALATVLISAVNSQGLSRQKTVAQQAAMDQIEEIRRLPYDDVGTVSGNPPGTVPATQTVTMSGIRLTIVTQITYVNDPTPTSYATSANYKRVTVTVRRTNDNHLLTREVTYIAPPARAPLGGLGNAIVNVQVVDYATNEPVEGATVDLATGPSAPRSDVTDSTGSVTFPALDPNPTSGADAYYDLTASLSGYVTLADDVSPGTAAHIQLAPGQTLNTAIRVYRPATIDVELQNADGSSYGGDATVTVSSSRGSESFPYSGSPITIDTINGELVVPSLEYTVSAQTSGGLDVTPVTQYVPDDYPNDLTSTFTLTLPPLGSLDVTVLQLGTGVAGATVTVSGGPSSITLTGTTDSNGVASFPDVPAGTGYSVTATYLGQLAAGEVDVTEGGSSTLTLSLPDPGTVAVTVLWAGSAVSNASVVLSGGPGSISVTGTTNASGVATFVNVPPGSGYSVTATKSGQSASQTGISVTAGGTADVTINLPTGSVVATVNSGGVVQSGATVVLSGGPMGLSVSGTTNGSGQVTFVNVPAGTGYTVTGSVGSASRSVSTSVTGGSTTNVTITLASLVVTVNSGGQTQASATVTLSGGPAGLNVSGTSNGSGQVTFLNVPTGSGYTASATKAGASGSTSVTISNGSNTATVTLPSVTVTVRRSSGSTDSGATVTLTGGPAGISLSGTSNGSGVVVFTNVPAGSGYTIKAWHCSISSTSKSRTLTSVTVAAGSNNVTAQFNSSTCPP
jgi:type II secretory pathway pseudopilin PulG